MKRHSPSCCLVIVFLLAATAVTPAVGQEVLAGLDLLETDPALTSIEFGGLELPPIPADFFDPGSNPFEGPISLDGGQVSPGLCPNDDLNGVDTVIRRLSDAQVPLDGKDEIPIEIVELSLVSVSPIVVGFSGLTPELWDVEVDLSTQPQSLGTMIIQRTHANGGVFVTDLPVLPRFTFTSVADGNKVRILDAGLVGIPPLRFISVGADPWEDKSPIPGSCTSNWCPTPGGPLILSASGTARLGAHPRCLEPTPTPVLSLGMMIALTALLLIAGTWLSRRRA